MEKPILAIIGCGVSGLTVFRSFINQLSNKNLNSADVLIFEKDRNIGKGLAYQFDLDTLLINSPLDSMSVSTKDQNEFLKWLSFNKNQDIENLINIGYVPRWIFGEYLNDTFKKILKSTIQLGISVKIIMDEVFDLEKIT